MKYCILKNFVCNSYTCCHYCSKNRTCSVACKDSEQGCKYISDKEITNTLRPPEVKPVVIKKKPEPVVQQASNFVLPKSLNEFRKMIQDYKSERIIGADGKGTNHHTAYLKKEYDSQVVSTSSAVDMYLALQKIRKDYRNAHHR